MTNCGFNLMILMKPVFGQMTLSYEPEPIICLIHLSFKIISMSMHSIQWKILIIEIDSLEIFYLFAFYFFFWQILETNLKFFYTNLSLKCFKLRLINVAKFYAYTSILTLENNVLFTIAKSCGEYFKKCIKCINITISNLAHVCNVNHQPWQLLRLAKNNRNASWLWTDLLFK